MLKCLKVKKIVKYYLYQVLSSSRSIKLIFLYHLIIFKYKDIIVTNKVNDLDKYLNKNKENNRNLFKNSKIEELKIILL